MVSSRGIFVNKEPTSRLAMCKLEFCSQIYFAKWNESMTVYSLAVEGVKDFSKNFANFLVGVYVACDFVRVHFIVNLKQNANFSFNI